MSLHLADRFHLPLSNSDGFRGRWPYDLAIVCWCAAARGEILACSIFLYSRTLVPCHNAKGVQIVCSEAIILVWLYEERNF